jgi:serine/threonine protein kinase
MSELLKSGQVVQSQSGQPCRVEKLLGSGGQGEVYKVNWAGGPYALKWYYPETATAEQRAILEKLLGGGQYKQPSEAFLWPLDIACNPGVSGFGYIMRLREPRFKSLLDLMTNRIDPTFRTLATAGLELADSFYLLHMQGLCYRDISFGNAFFDAQSGEVLICDNDNVAENRSGKGGILGTPDFMAPEIVRGAAPPSRETDRFSLAVLLFYIFFISHPLKGRKILSIRSWDSPAREKVFGTEPIFIFDPNDKSNEAVDKSEDPLMEAGHWARVYWKIFPQFFRDAFTKAFTEGIRDPEQGRVQEGEWREVLSSLRDSIYYCPACSKIGTENFYDAAAVKASGGKPGTCWSCKRELRLPFRIRIGNSVVMLTHEGKLYKHHLDNARAKDYDFTKPAAEVVRHPTDPNIWGLKNCTTEKWVATMPDGKTVKDVEPGRSVPLATNTKVNFGKVEGEIHY